MPNQWLLLLLSIVHLRTGAATLPDRRIAPPRKQTQIDRRRRPRPSPGRPYESELLPLSELRVVERTQDNVMTAQVLSSP